MTRTYTAVLRGKTRQVTSDDLKHFAEMYVDDAELFSRMSELFWFDLYILDAEFGVSPHDVLRSVHELETGQQGSGVKAETPFSREPLKGLWHKHYFSAHFLVHNIIAGLGKNGTQKSVEEIFDSAKSSTVTKEMIHELARRVTTEPVEKRAAANKLTGEWIVYLPHRGKNFYLCLNTHNAGDHMIFDRITEHCVRDFPDLPRWIAEAKASS